MLQEFGYLWSACPYTVDLTWGWTNSSQFENTIQFDDSDPTSHDMAITMVPVDSACQIGLDSRLREDLTIVGGSSWGVDKIAADYSGRKSKIILVIAILPAKIWPRE